MSLPTEPDKNRDQRLESPLPRPTGRNANAGGGADADAESHAAPDADADRNAPTPPAAPDLDDPQIAKPLGIKQIEDLEDDAKGG